MRILKKNLVLTGMMGVGKSTIGKTLAKRLNLKFVDIDLCIEKKEGKSIREIFKDKGETHFRKLEKRITLDELKKSNTIIALGGGAIINQVVRKEIKNCSISFWLDVSVKFLLLRLKNIKKRPLLDSTNLEYKINKIYSERKKFYNESNFRVKCNTATKEEIINKVKKLYEDARNKS